VTQLSVGKPEAGPSRPGRLCAESDRLRRASALIASLLFTCQPNSPSYHCPQLSPRPSSCPLGYTGTRGRVMRSGAVKLVKSSGMAPEYGR